MIISVENFVFRPYLRVSLLSLLPLRVLEKLRLSMSLTLIERKLVTVFSVIALSLAMLFVRARCIFMSK